jgi:hypothetical protein
MSQSNSAWAMWKRTKQVSVEMPKLSDKALATARRVI